MKGSPILRRLTVVAGQASACEIAVSILTLGLVLARVWLARVKIDVAEFSSPEWRALALEGKLTGSVHAALCRNALRTKGTRPAVSTSE